MYFVEIPKTIRLILVAFAGFGLWTIEDKTFCSKIVKLFLFIFYASFPMSIGAGCLVNDDMDDSVFLADAGITISVQVVRFFYIIWRKNEICEFVNKVGCYIVDNHKEFRRAKVQIKKLMEFSVCLILIMLIIFVLALGFYAIAKGRKLPFNIVFPMDWKNSDTGYWTAFSYLSVQVIYSAVIVSFNIIIWYLMLSFSIKYELLGSQFRRMGTKESYTSEVLKENYFLQDLIALIKVHQSIRRQVDQFQSCFSTLFFIQIATSGLSICGSVYVLAFSSHKNLFQSGLYAVFLLHSLFDVFVIMYLGNEIKLSSDYLSYYLFECNWMEQSNKLKKYVIIVAEVVKKPIELVIGTLYPLNLATFTSILKLAYSMFNILKNFN